MPDFEKEKKLAARKSLDFIQPGMNVGLGTGSTASYFIEMLGERVREGLRITAIPTSIRTMNLARKLQIPLTDYSEIRSLDVTVDGADEIDPGFNLIKGGGGALLREKIVASTTDRLIIVGDSRKSVLRLGKFPLPVEVIPFGWQVVADRIRQMGAEVKLRVQDSGLPLRTVEQNYILDCEFGLIEDERVLSQDLDAIIGVVEHGLFLQLARVVIIGEGDRCQVHSRN